MSKTAMSAALEAVGINPAEYRLAAAIQAFFQQGGTIARAHALVDEVAARMPGGGQFEHASDGHKSYAAAGQPVGGEGAIVAMLQGHVPIASSPSPNRGGEGQLSCAPERQGPPALPVREPAITKRGLASILSMQDPLKRGLLQMKKTSDGRPWGDVGWHELDGMDRDGTIARLIKRTANPPSNRFAPLKNCLSESQFKDILDEAKKQNDVIHL